MFNIITESFSTNIIHELKKHIDNGSLDGEILTLCDLRRKIEEKYGIGFFSTEEILLSIKETGGIFTTRLEEDTGDICYIEWDNIEIYLEKLKNSKNIKNKLNLKIKHNIG
ncbi:MAG: hypothetical protein NWP80_00605 [Candidatus Gracilibacteria bacterium]|nr:hypothetical protein [Candidatus Gracilibacteria bacterium]